MLTTPYTPPFACEVPVVNPWDGRHAVDLALHGATPFDDAKVQLLRERVGTFWALADAGGLAGTAVAPWLSICNEPVINVHQGAALLQFEPCTLDDRATECLLSLLLAFHEEVPLLRATLSTSASARRQLASDPKLEDPYPGLWSRLPFVHEIEESESEARVLIAAFAADLTEDQVAKIHALLMRWGQAAAEGAFGVAPVEPSSCGCLPVNPVEAYRGELSWPVEKCRFHLAALRSLVAVCATIHHRVAEIRTVLIE